MGIEYLSMAPSVLPRVKKTLRTITVAQAMDLFEHALDLPDGKTVRAMVCDALEEAELGGLVRAGC